jgi:hypothetical protein
METDIDEVSRPKARFYKSKTGDIYPACAVFEASPKTWSPVSDVEAMHYFVRVDADLDALGLAELHAQMADQAERDATTRRAPKPARAQRAPRVAAAPVEADTDTDDTDDASDLDVTTALEN